MTHPTDDEIMGLWRKLEGEQWSAEDWDSRLPIQVMFARALLAEQARTEPTDKQAMRNEIGGIMLPGDGVQDNLAIALATYFEQDRECPEDGEKDECGWKVWAIERVNYVLDEITKLVIAQPLKAEQAKDAAEDAELLDRYGKIRGDLKASAYCVGNEYKPFHPGASHVRPEWRDGWNACFVAAIKAQGCKQ